MSLNCGVMGKLQLRGDVRSSLVAFGRVPAFGEWKEWDTFAAMQKFCEADWAPLHMHFRLEGAYQGDAGTAPHFDEDVAGLRVGPGQVHMQDMRFYQESRTGARTLLQGWLVS
jgi:hypothetical protein